MVNATRYDGIHQCHNVAARRIDEIGCAKLVGKIRFCGLRVDGDDPLGTDQARTGQNVETDATNADHDDWFARPLSQRIAMPGTPGRLDRPRA